MRTPASQMLAAFAVVGFVLAAGCGGKPAVVEPMPLIAVVTIEVAEALNPDVSGRPSPVFLKLYALRDAAPLMTADFDVLISDELSVLAPVTVLRQELTVKPGQGQSLDWSLDQSVRAIAAMAEFRDPNASTWRAATPIPAGVFKAGAPLAVTVRMKATSVQIVVVD